MANTIRLKSGSGNNPSASDLVIGEVALRTDGNPKLFTKNDAGNVLEVGLVESGSIVAGSIVNADINASAAIAGSKISPDFGSQNISTTGTLGSSNFTITNTYPSIFLVDSDNNDDFSIQNQNGLFAVRDETNSANRFTIGSDGTVDVVGNLDVGAGLDVTGDTTITGKFITNSSSSGNYVRLYAASGTGKWDIYGNGANLRISDNNSAGSVVIDTNLDVGAGVDVTGNITVSGTVDGVDIATRDTLFGGLTSSSGVLTNGVTATTQSASDNSTKVATTAYTDTAISNLVDSSPDALNTLNELAAALGDDANFSTTVTNSIATKLPLAGGTLTGNLKIVSDTLKLFLGAQEEMQVFHDGTSSLIKDTRNGGKVRIQADNFDFIDKDASGVILSATSSGLSVTGAITATGDLTISSATPIINLTDTNHDSDYQIKNGNGEFNIKDVTNGSNRLTINANGTTILKSAEHDGGLQVLANGNNQSTNLKIQAKASNGTEHNWNLGVARSVDRLGIDNGSTTHFCILDNGNIGIGTINPVPSATNYNSASLHIHQTNSSSAGSQIHLTNGATGAAAGNGAHISMWSDDDLYITNQESDGKIKFTSGGNSDVLTINDDGTVDVAGNLGCGDITIGDASPAINFNDSDENPDYQIRLNGGILKFTDTTNSADRIQINADGHVDVLGNLDVGGGLDVTGALDVGANAAIFGTLTISNATPTLIFTEDDANPDYKQLAAGGEFVIQNNQGGSYATRFKINADGHIDIAGNVDFGAGIDVTGICTATTFSGSGASLTNIPAGQLTGTLPALDGSNLTGLTVNNANTLDNLDSTQFVRSDAEDTISAPLSISAGTANATNDASLYITASNNNDWGLKINKYTSNANNYGVRIEVGSSADNALQIRGDNAEKFRVKGDGSVILSGSITGSGDVTIDTSTFKVDSSNNRVGVGTSTPSETFDVYNSTNNSRVLRISHPQYPTAAGAFFGWSSDGSGTTNNLFNIGVQYSSSYYNVINIKRSEQKVGINNNNPTESLDVTGNIAVSGTVDGRDVAADGTKLDTYQANGSSYLRSDTNTTATGILTLTSSSQYPLNINSSHNGKIVFQGSSSPYIQFREGTTDKAYIQWNSGGFLEIANQESSESLRIASGSNGLAFVEGGSEKTVWHSGNDGSGSGLDADTVDGIQASNFVRSDGNDTMDGSYTITGSGNEKIKLSGSTNPLIRWQESSTNKAYIQWNSGSGFLGLYNQEDSSSLRVKDTIDFSTDGSTYHTVWYAGNDGSGSGLDADTLDGVQGASYLRSDTDDTFGANLTVDNGSSTLVRVKCDNDGNAVIRAGGEGQGTGAVEVAQSDSYGGGFSYNGDGSPSYVSGETADHIVFYRLDNGTRTEVFHYPYNSNTVNFNERPTIGHVGIVKSDDTIAQATNASTLDSLDSTQFLRSDAFDTASGQISFTSSTQYPVVINSSQDGKLLLQGSSDPYIRFREGTTDKAYIQFSSNGSFYIVNQESGEFIRLADGSNGLQFGVGAGTYNVWHQGNDGSGSGLDADTVDGLNVHTATNNEADKIVRTDSNGYINAGWINTTSGDTGTGSDCTRFYASQDAYLRYIDLGSMRSVMNVSAVSGAFSGREDYTSDSNYWVGTQGWGTSNFDTTVWDFGSCFFDTWSNPSGQPSGSSHWLGVQAMHYTNQSNRYGMRITMGAGQTSLAYIQGRWATTTYGWHKLWNEANDGSGSGLDADTLDGIDQSSFVRSDASDTMAGTYNISSKKLGLGTTPGNTFGNRNAALAIGDNDTGIAQNGDGQLELWANNQEIMNLDTGGISAYQRIKVDESSHNDLILWLNATNTNYVGDGLKFHGARGATSANNFCAFDSGHASSADREFTLRGDGNAYADGTWNNNGADYAEFFESSTGSAIPVGTTVVLENNKVRAATSSDAVENIIGVVRPKEASQASMTIGNTAWNKWQNKYLTDDFDRYILDDHNVIEWTDADGTFHNYESHAIPSDVTIPSDAKISTHDSKGNKYTHYRMNPDFDSSKTYVPRHDRDEWIIIGLVGQVKTLKGQIVNNRWIKMRDVSDTVEEYFIR